MSAPEFIVLCVAIGVLSGSTITLGIAARSVACHLKSIRDSLENIERIMRK